MGDGDAGFTWLAAFDWMDKQLSASGPAAQEADPVRVAPREGENYETTNALSQYQTESYPSVAAATAPLQRQYLDTTPGLLGLTSAKTLSATAGPGTTQLREGQNLMMTNGLPMYEGAAEVITGMPTSIALGLVDPGVTGVWTGQPVKTAQKIRGAVQVHLSLTPSASGAGSIFAYLLDQAPDGTTSMVGHVPYSWLSGKAGQAQTIDTVIPYQGYNLPAGHKLIAAVSTGDVMYTSRNPSLSHVTIGTGSYFGIPMEAA
jgi:predicted acyl esterase